MSYHLYMESKQRNLSMKQKQTCRHREQTCVCWGGREIREGWTGSLVLADANFIHRMDRQHGPAHGTVFNIM